MRHNHHEDHQRLATICDRSYSTTGSRNSSKSEMKQALLIKTKKRPVSGFLVLLCLLCLVTVTLHFLEPWRGLEERWTKRRERHAKMEKRCFLQTDHALQKSLVRIVVLQKGGAFQLETFLKHYSQVFPWEDIVIIDNMSEDPTTLDLLSAYSQKGVHVWKCNAKVQYMQGAMVTHVMQWVAPHSDFVLPVDVDELLGVRVTTTTGSGTQEPIASANPPLPTSVVWNPQAFSSALMLLDTSAGKQIKMSVVNPIPTACQYDPDDDENNSALPTTTISSSTSPLSNDLQRDFCHLKYAKFTPMECRSKSFVMGKDFLNADEGNHHISTHQHPLGIHQTPCRADNPLAECQFAHGLVLVHARDLNLVDWIFQGLRGAVADGHNHKAPNGCQPPLRGAHVCHKWDTFNQVAFHPDILQQQFLADRCPTEQLERPRDANATLRIDALIQASCRS